MERKKTLLILILVFAVLLGGAYVLYDRLGQTVNRPGLEVTPSTDATQESIRPPAAPDFTVYDLEGREVHLTDFVGKPVVVNFWASWCGPCQMEMPDFQKKYEELGDKVHFLMVNMTDGMRETLSTASAFIAQKGYTFPVYYDTTTTAAMTYGASSLPTTYFIDAEGGAITRAVGALTAEALQYGIDMILP